MERNQGSSMQKDSKLHSSECQENDQKTAFERWETKLANCEITSQAMWLIAKSLTKMGGPKALKPPILFNQ